jgi:ferredoxin
MKAFVDKDACIGCGLCESVCPRAFRMNDQGIAEPVSEDLPAELAECAGEAEAQCPVEAIRLEK